MYTLYTESVRAPFCPLNAVADHLQHTLCLARVVQDMHQKTRRTHAPCKADSSQACGTYTTAGAPAWCRCCPDAGSACTHAREFPLRVVVSRNKPAPHRRTARRQCQLWRAADAESSTSQCLGATLFVYRQHSLVPGARVGAMMLNMYQSQQLIA